MIYRKIVLPMLAAYGKRHGDDECAHELAAALIKILQRVPGLMGLIELVTDTASKAKPRKVFGLTFPSPIGLAAGLDKTGVGLPFWKASGFGFVEVGTVTPRRQPGNPRPRVFRLDEEQMLINRLGFNGPGMGTVRSNVSRTKRHIGMPIGISLGAMKDTLNESPEEAKYDYLAVGKEFVGVSDFNIVNVSSPNTPGLRELQGKRYIEDLLHTVVFGVSDYADRIGKPVPPVIAKVAPDLTVQELEDVIEALLAAGAAGLVIGNTTIKRPAPIPAARMGVYNETGGLSGGEWLFNKTLELCKHARKVAPKLPLVHVGGIDSGEKAKRALESADLIEVLTGFVFQGPALIWQIRRALAAL